MATHIQIGDISPRIQYTGDGVQTVFTYPFPIFVDADIEVYEDAVLKVMSTDYTVSGAGNSSGGTITLTAAPASGTMVTIRRNIAIQRTSDFQVAGEFRAEIINDELDYQTAALQQVETNIVRSLQLGPTDSGATTLPDKAARSGKYLGFDVNGDPIATDAAGPIGPPGPVGNMDGANNLNELTSLPTARTNLGLVIGTDVLAPAGDGSGLTGIVSGATAAEKSNIMLNAFRIEVNGGLAVQNMVDGVADTFTDETGIDTVNSLNETYDPTNKFYGNDGGFTADVIPTMTSNTTPSGTASASTVLNGTYATWHAMADDGATSSWISSTPGAGWLAYDFGSAKTIKQFTFLPRSTHTEQLPKDFTFEGWTGSAWVVLDTFTGQTYTDGVTSMFSSANATAYNKYRINATSLGANNGEMAIGEWEMMEAATPLNMILISNATTALSTPTSAFIVIEEEDVGAVTPNTDLKAYASRDGGITWTVGTLALATGLTTGRILTTTIDVSAQPAGTSMKYKIETLNAKQLKIHSVALQWS